MKVLDTSEEYLAPDELLKSVASSVSAGGQEMLHKPPTFSCSAETHEPFRIMSHPARFDDSDLQFIWGVVRTVGAQFDGNRTDIHDVLSLVWGAVLRAFGLCSVLLVDEPHVVVPGEIGARHLLFQQCPWSFSEDGFPSARKSMNAWSAFISHLLEDVFRWDRGKRFTRPTVANLPETRDPKWTYEVKRYLRFPKDVLVQRRMFPVWDYFGSISRGSTIIVMPKTRVSLLKGILTPFAPEMVRGEQSYSIFANGIPNAVPYTFEKKAWKFLTITEDQCTEPLVLPMDSHCLFIGDKTIVALRGEFGREPFEREREALISRRASENRVFFTESVLQWQMPIEPGDFEKLCLDLIRREPGVIRAKLVGTVNDRDGGRDILIDWMTPAVHSADAHSDVSRDENDIKSDGTRIIRVIAQVKSSLKTIGKNQVLDIRDTVEHYQADGFLLIASPGISSALVDHLDELRNRGKTNTDWWEIDSLNERLRRHPDIAKRYPKVVELQALE